MGLPLLGHPVLAVTPLPPAGLCRSEEGTDESEQESWGCGGTRWPQHQGQQDGSKEVPGSVAAPVGGVALRAGR